MFTTIIVPLDRSAFAELAVPYAIEVARATGAAVRLALVHFPVWGTAEDVPTAIYDEAEADIRKSESSYLDELAAELARRTGLDVRPQMLEGPVAPALREFTDTSSADLVVMSTHGHGGLKRAWLGSVTDALLRHVAVPLLIVRPGDDLAATPSRGSSSQQGEGGRAATSGAESESGAEPTEHAARPAFASLGPGGLAHVLIAVDGSRIADEAARRAGDLAASCDARVTLLRVVHPPLHLTSAYLPHVVRLNRDELELREADANAHVSRLVGELREHRVQAAQRIVIDYHTADAILREAADLGADLIAVGTHGRGGVRRLVLGSVADKVIRGASPPVFVLPAHAVDAAEQADDDE